MPQIFKVKAPQLGFKLLDFQNRNLLLTVSVTTAVSFLANLFTSKCFSSKLD